MNFNERLRQLRQWANEPIQGECISCHQLKTVFRRQISDETGLWDGLVCDLCFDQQYDDLAGHTPECAADPSPFCSCKEETTNA